MNCHPCVTAPKEAVYVRGGIVEVVECSVILSRLHASAVIVVEIAIAGIGMHVHNGMRWS